MIRPTLAVAAVSALAIGGCGSEDVASQAAAGAAEELTVVATTTQAADLVRAVAGRRATVIGLLPANADPHDYELRPDDVERVAEADLLVRSGGDLDEWLQDALDGSGTDAETLVLLDHAKTITGSDELHHEDDEHADQDHDEGDAVDPHWWHDPRNGALAVAAIRDALTGADSGGTQEYAANAQRYTARLRALDGAAADCLGAVAPDERKLVTTHDALGYFAERYGFDVVGTVIPSRSTQAQASAGETVELIETIRREGVKALYAESSFNVDLEKVIAEETGARLGAPLFADTLGPEGSGGATYLEALAANTRAIALGLSDGEVRCDLPE
jgi:zinc/manganese transport system substrate-binding protein